MNDPVDSKLASLRRRAWLARKGHSGAGNLSFQREVRAALRQLTDQTRAVAGRVEALGKPDKPTPKAPEFPADFEPEVRETIKLVRPYTRTSNEKLQVLIKAVEYLERSHIPGAYVECGVWRGGSMHAVARTLHRLGVDDRELYLFDTYEGMTEPTERDVKIGGKTAAEMLASAEKTGDGVWAIASLPEVQAGVKRLPYPFERFHFAVGMVEDTVPDQAPDQIAMLRLDTDWYESTRHELQQLYPRLAPGGVLIVDDYGWFKGSREATDEYLATLALPQHLIRAGSGAIGIKPGLH